jgi:oxygen-independent coproporphyrinogen III oxidase
LAALREIGVYLHYPWCRKLCPYCDFAVEVGTPEHEVYLDAVLRELDLRASEVSGRLVSIYLGGGTPSLWRPECIAGAIAAIRARYDAHAALEVTIEANPTDCDGARLAAWREAGINRISIGVQSLAADELVTLGRDHRFGDGMAALARVIAFGGFACSCDFILGTPPRGNLHPGWKEPDLLRRLGWIDEVTSTAVDHLSVYELTIEERTAFGQRVRAGRLLPMNDDALADLYIEAHEQLTARGFEHYEISSYARPGKRAVHNSLYWRGAPFLGLGVGAASLVIAPDGSGVRATNPRRAADYLAAPGTPADRLVIDANEMAADRAWLGLRTSDGVVEADLPTQVASWLVTEGLAERLGGRICPTLRGFLMADRIAARVVQAL